MKKVVIVGAGDIAKNTLDAIFKIFPKDKEVEIVLLNRNKEKAEVVYSDAFVWQDYISFSKKPKGIKSKIISRVSSESKDLQNADIIIFTVGITAASIGSSRRETALPFVYKLICDYASQIKIYAPDSFILMITNPVDITTWIMQEKTGFPPERVLGFGCELDSRRFIRVFRQELEKIGAATIGTEISADVIGGHSEGDMVVPRQSIVIDGEFFDNFRTKFQGEKEQIDKALNVADQKMTKEGFRIVNAGLKASIVPAIFLAVAAKALLDERDDEVIFMSCSQVLTPERSYHGIDDSCISVPVEIGFKRSRICTEKYQLSAEEVGLLIFISKKYKSLFNEVKSMSPQLTEVLTAHIEDLKKKSKEANVAANKANEAAQDFLQKTKEAEQKSKEAEEKKAEAAEALGTVHQMFAKLLQVLPSEGNFSEVGLAFKPESAKMFSPEDRKGMLNTILGCLKANGITGYNIPANKEIIFVPRSQGVLKTLAKMGIVGQDSAISKL